VHVKQPASGNNKYKEINNLQTGDLVRIYERTPDGSATDTVLVSPVRMADHLLELPSGTVAMVTDMWPGVDDPTDERPVIRVLVDGLESYVHLENCVAFS
jgi:hypothetical protein